MIEIQVEAAEVLAIVQELFPREYTIAAQRAHILKLEVMVEAKNGHSNSETSDLETV